MSDPRLVTNKNDGSLYKNTNRLGSLNSPSEKSVKQFKARSLLNGNQSNNLTRDKIANSLSNDATLNKVSEAQKAIKTKKIFVKNLTSTGANITNYSFIGGRHIQIEATAGAAFGHEGFAYKVKSYEYNNGGHRIPRAEPINPKYGTFVVNTFNYGFGSTKYQKNHISSVSSPQVQKNFVEWTVTIPPQTSSNYNSSGFSLNVYQIID